MIEMAITYKIIDTLNQYQELLAIMDLEKRKNHFHFAMMKLFEKMWDLINVPLKAKNKMAMIL